MDDEKIILEFGQQEMRSCSSRVVSNASKCHEFSQSGVAVWDCGRILNGVSAQVRDQGQIIITDRYKKMATQFVLVRKQFCCATR